MTDQQRQLLTEAHVQITQARNKVFRVYSEMSEPEGPPVEKRHLNALDSIDDYLADALADLNGLNL